MSRDDYDARKFQEFLENENKKRQLSLKHKNNKKKWIYPTKGKN